MEFQKLLYSVEDHVASIRLNTPDKLNVLGIRSWQELAAAFGLAQADDEVYAILLSGYCGGRREIRRNRAAFFYHSTTHPALANRRPQS